MIVCVCAGWYMSLEFYWTLHVDGKSGKNTSFHGSRLCSHLSAQAGHCTNGGAGHTAAPDILLLLGPRSSQAPANIFFNLSCQALSGKMDPRCRPFRFKIFVLSTFVYLNEIQVTVILRPQIHTEVQISFSLLETITHTHVCASVVLENKPWAVLIRDLKPDTSD